MGFFSSLFFCVQSQKQREICILYSSHSSVSLYVRVRFFVCPFFVSSKRIAKSVKGKKCSSFRLTILRMTSDRSVSIMRNNMCSIRIVWHYQQKRERESELGQEEKKRHTHMNRASKHIITLSTHSFIRGSVSTTTNGMCRAMTCHATVYSIFVRI